MDDKLIEVLQSIRDALDKLDDRIIELEDKQGIKYTDIGTELSNIELLINNWICK